jgi:glycosyltransferase involved in cell wall biosynthesis
MGNRPKIGLDVVPMHYPFSGVRAAVVALIDACRNRDAGIDLVPLAAPRSLTRSSNRLSRVCWDMRSVAEWASMAKVDVLHMTRFAAPRRFDQPMVVTVHDLIPLQLPEYRSSRPARIQGELARRTVPHATRVIVPSQFVASVVNGLLGIDHALIDVIPMGVSVPRDDGQPAIFSGPYLLHTGGFDARKNLPLLLRAFQRASRHLDPNWRLVLVGAPHSGNSVVYPPIGPVIQELGLRDRVVLTGRVSEWEKHALYRHAALVANPSLSEGFGLPILEAMAHGVPVIASDRTSHPEVAGDAAILVEPTIDAFADAIARLATDDALKIDLIEKGRLRAAEFPWSRTAQATIETYQRALSPRS